MPELLGLVKANGAPSALPVNLASIPTALCDRPRWVCWRYRWQADQSAAGGKWKKPPYFPCDEGHPASVTDPDTWSAFREAADAHERGHYAGLGLVLADERGQDGDLTLYALDIDHCRDPQTGDVEAEAARVVAELDSWTEVSPSGEGLHVWFLADLPTTGRRVGRYEIYADGRYMTVTGHPLGNRPPLPQERQEAGMALLGRLLTAETPVKTNRPAVQPVPTVAMPDADVLRRASGQVGGHVFAELLRGGHAQFIKDDGSPDPSAADLSFCARLAFYTQSVEQIVAIWRASARWRAKLDQKIQGTDYAHRTAQIAIASQPNYWSPNFRSGKPSPKADVAEGLLNGNLAPTHIAPPPPTVSVNSSPTSHSADAAVQGDMPFILATSIKPEKVAWFLHPYVARADLTFIVGPRNAGKSLLTAYLASLAKMAVIFTSAEESVASKMLPRLIAHGVDINRVLFVPPSGWKLPSCASRLVAGVSRVQADLIIMDPIDSYLDDGFVLNDETMVRGLLETAIRVAVATGAAFVMVRHPGKAIGNICPNSRAWANVPRVVIQLLHDLRKPPRRFLRLAKDSHGTGATDTYYDLVSQGKERSPLFKLGTPVRQAESDLVDLMTDPGEVRKLDQACKHIRDWLQSDPVEAGWILYEAKKLGIGSTTLYAAAERLGVTHRSVGGGKSTQHFWDPPAQWPPV